MNKNTRKFNLRIFIILLTSMGSIFAIYAPADAMPIGALSDARVQEQLLVTGLVNLAVDMTSLIASSRLGAAFADPTAWCQPDSAIGDQRLHAGVVSAFSLYPVVIIGEVKYEMRSDLGMTFISGFVGYLAGHYWTCSLTERMGERSKLFRAILNLGTPLVISTVSNIFGYHLRFVESGQVLERAH